LRLRAACETAQSRWPRRSPGLRRSIPLSEARPTVHRHWRAQLQPQAQTVERRPFSEAVRDEPPCVSRGHPAFFVTGRSRSRHWAAGWPAAFYEARFVKPRRSCRYLFGTARTPLRLLFAELTAPSRRRGPLLASELPSIRADRLSAAHPIPRSLAGDWGVPGERPHLTVGSLPEPT
jgi:hypothetical protein